MTKEFTRASLTAAFAASVGMFVGTTPMIAATQSIFMSPISQEFGLSRTIISLILICAPLTVAFTAPIGGRLMDRFGVRTIVLPVVLLFAFGQLAMSFVTNAYQVAAVYVVLGLCGAVHTYPAYTKVLSGWFTHRRGLMMGLVIASGSSVGAILMPQLVRYMMEAYGWRTAFQALAAVVSLWGLPILFLFLREARRETVEINGQTSAAPVEGLTRAEALKTRILWTILVSLFLGPFAIYGTVIHAVPMLTERGISILAASSAISLFFAGGLVGQLSAGFFLDRVTSPKVAIPFFICAFAGAVILHTLSHAPTLLAGSMLLGLGQGAELTIAAYFVTRYFGLKGYGAIYGLVFGAATGGAALGIFSSGFVYDLAGSYGPMHIALPLCLAAIPLLIFTLPKYTFARARPGEGPAAGQDPKQAAAANPTS
jgi:MFS family permease